MTYLNIWHPFESPIQSFFFRYFLLPVIHRQTWKGPGSAITGGASVSIALLRDGRPILGVVYAYCAQDDAGDMFAWAENSGPLKRNGSAIHLDRASLADTVLVSHHADRNALANA
jgi:hypothetical protein